MGTSANADSPVRSTLVGLGIIGLVFLVANLISIPLVLVEPGALDPEQSASRSLTVLGLLLNFAAYGIAGGIYLAMTDRGRSFVDLRVPTRADWRWIVVATVGSIAFITGFSTVVQLLGLPQASNDIVRIIGDDRVLLFTMFGIVVFANAPAEEFLFRNVIQKRLYEGFSVWGAIVLTSVLFAFIHVPSYFVTGTVTAGFVSLLAVFSGSVIFGYAYAKTENLVVPTAAHAGYNLFQFSLLYVQLEYGAVDTASEVAGAGLALVPL